MRLLLVEDDLMLARGVAAALSQSGYAVETAATAAQALRLARSSEFDVGILDLGLPDRDRFCFFCATCASTGSRYRY